MEFILERARTGSFEATMPMKGVEVRIAKGQTCVALEPTGPPLEVDKLKVSMYKGIMNSLPISQIFTLPNLSVCRTSNERMPWLTLLEGVLQHVEEAWDILTKDNCVPVHVALQLMDHSSLGRGNDYQDFQRTSHQLQKALKAIVNGTRS